MVPGCGAVSGCIFEGPDVGVGVVKDGEEVAAISVECLEHAADGKEAA